LIITKIKQDERNKSRILCRRAANPTLSLSFSLCGLGFQTGCNYCIPTKAGCPKNWIQELRTRKSEEEDDEK